MALETKPAKEPGSRGQARARSQAQGGAGHRAGAGREEFWQSSAMRLGDQPEQNVEVIPTGSLALDMALGIGGLPKGRIVEIYGPRIIR